MGLRTEKSAAAAESEGSNGGASVGGSAVRTAETLLRVAPMALCLAALIVMLKNSEDNDFGSVSYSDLTPFSYLVYANGICAGYSLLSAFFTAVPRPSSLSRAWTVFFFDQVIFFTFFIFPSLSAKNSIFTRSQLSISVLLISKCKVGSWSSYRVQS